MGVWKRSQIKALFAGVRPKLTNAGRSAFGVLTQMWYPIF